MKVVKKEKRRTFCHNLASGLNGINMLKMKEKNYFEDISSWSVGNKNYLELQPFKTISKLLRFHSDRLYQYFTIGDTFPVHAEINLTNACSQRCPWCINANINANGEKTEYLEVNNLSQFLMDFKRLGGRAITWSGGGEPTQHPGFAETIKECYKVGLQQALITNGTFNEGLVSAISDHMEWIRISFDTINSEEYKKQKGTDITVAIDRISKLVSAKKSRVTPSIGINVNLAEWNIFDIENILSKFKKIGIDYIQFRPILGRPFDVTLYREQLTPSFIKTVLPKLQLLAQKTSSYKVIISMDKFSDLLKPNYGRTYKSCRYHRLLCVLNANGDLSVCMYHLSDKRFIFGNIYHQSLESIWHGEQRKRVVNFCENGGLDLTTCQVCCKGHELNKLLDYLSSEKEGPLRELLLQTEEVKNGYNRNFL